MKIDISSIDREQFMVHDHVCNGETLYLVQPQHIGCKWTRQNKIFRSSVWNSAGELVSAGFPKFVNWGEQPDTFPTPKSLDGCTAVEKIDGSLLIVSKYKGHLITRTRGTIDASVHGNGGELQELQERYPKVFDIPESTTEYSLLLEWVSPMNRIVLNYGDKPDLFLVGVVFHKDYSIGPQVYLDQIARELEVQRPKTYNWDELLISSKEDLISVVEQWKGKEGICLYSKEDQMIHKIKGTWYLDLHHLKSEISNTEKLVDVYMNWGMPSYVEFEKKIVETFDYELFIQVRGDVSKICDAQKEATHIIEGMRAVVARVKDLPRKDAALQIIAAYGQTGRSGIVFHLLNGKPVMPDNWKTLIMQVLK